MESRKGQSSVVLSGVSRLRGMLWQQRPEPGAGERVGDAARGVSQLTSLHPSVRTHQCPLGANSQQRRLQPVAVQIGLGQPELPMEVEGLESLCSAVAHVVRVPQHVGIPSDSQSINGRCLLIVDGYCSIPEGKRSTSVFPFRRQ